MEFQYLTPEEVEKIAFSMQAVKAPLNRVSQYARTLTDRLSGNYVKGKDGYLRLTPKGLEKKTQQSIAKVQEMHPNNWGRPKNTFRNPNPFAKMKPISDATPTVNARGGGAIGGGGSGIHQGYGGPTVNMTGIGTQPTMPHLDAQELATKAEKLYHQTPAGMRDKMSVPFSNEYAYGMPIANKPFNQGATAISKKGSFDMDYFDQGYADQLAQLGIYKEAAPAFLGKVRDMGSRMMGASPKFVGARRQAINEGRSAVTAAKEQKALAGVKSKYQGKVNKIREPQPPKTQAGGTPPPAEGAAAAEGAAGPEGPGMWQQTKEWWSKRSPGQKGVMAAGVGIPVAGGLYMAGKDNPPSVAQQQYGYTPQY